MNCFGRHLALRKREPGLLVSMADYAIRHPWQILLMISAAVLAISPGVCRLKIRTDGYALIPNNAPEVIYDRELRAHFGVRDKIIVVVHSAHPDGIFNRATVQLVRELTTGFACLPGIDSSNVVSLATEPDFRFRPGTFVTQRLLEPALTNQTQLEQLRSDLDRIKLYNGTLVSTDGRSTAILIGIPNDANRLQVCRAVGEMIAAKQGAEDSIGMTGAPVAECLLGNQILEDLGVPPSLTGISLAGDPPWKWPSSLHELRIDLVRHVGLVPLAALVMMTVFLVCFRNVLAALLPLPGAMATILCVFGIMGWSGVPVYLTTAVMPVLLMVISITNDIYLFSRYFNLLRKNPEGDHLELLRETFHALAVPVAGTSLAAVAGFLSFSFSPLAPVRMFGLFTGLGAVAGLLFSFTVVPALLALAPPGWLVSRGRKGTESVMAALSGGFGVFGGTMVRWRWWALGFGCLLLALAAPGLQRLKVQDSWINGFDPESKFRQITQQVNGDFFGIHELLVSFDATRTLSGTVSRSNPTDGFIELPQNTVEDATLIAGSPIEIISKNQLSDKSVRLRSGFATPSQIRTAFCREDGVFVSIADPALLSQLWDELRNGPGLHFDIAEHSLLQPENIAAIDKAVAFIRQRREDAVGGALGPADYLETTRFMLRNTDPKARQIPETPAEVKQLWQLYGDTLGPKRLKEIVDANYSSSLATVFLKDANFVDTARLMNAIRGYARINLEPQGIKIGFGGDVAVSQALIHGIVVTQLQSLIWSLLGIFLVAAWLGGSWRRGFYCLLPSALAVLVKFAVMGWVGIPLGVATSMFAAMTLGIGVNCAIHLLEGFHQARAKGMSKDAALNTTLQLTGPPALINTLAMSLGFAVLMLSQVPANSRLGLLLVLGLANCFAASLLLLPVLLNGRPVRSKIERKTLQQVSQ
jgi:hypothetical protein